MKKQVVYNLIDFRPYEGTYSFDSKELFKIESMKYSIQYKAGTKLDSVEVSRLIESGYQVNIRQPTSKDMSEF